MKGIDKKRVATAVSMCVLGIAAQSSLDIAGNIATIYGNNIWNEETYKEQGLQELYQRLNSYHQGHTLSPNSCSIMNSLDQLYESKESETGKPKFEGMRIENIITKIKEIGVADDTEKILNIISDLRSRPYVIFAPLKSSENNAITCKGEDRERADHLASTINDSACCIAAISEKVDSPIENNCKLGKYPTPRRQYCIYNPESSEIRILESVLEYKSFANVGGEL